jgi:phosphoribosylformylglycinamidine (FGAM) synthase PurS component
MNLRNKNKVEATATRTIENNIKNLSFDKVAVLIIGCMFSITSIAAGAPVGKWQTIDDESGKPKSIIEIYSVEDVLEGKIIELLDLDSSSICKECKDERANKPLVGMVILWGVTGMALT